ncbi:MAG: glycosyl hydrolase, partial [Muribaculaceae bacterium]|nr:glycosyl hydrolase [Muribaculaceae bacterium]
MKRLLISALSAAALAVAGLSAAEPTYPFRDPALGFEARIDDLMARLTLDEKVAMMNYKSPAIERLGIPAYNWWNEGLHGVARTGEHVTSFPQAIGMAATFDSEGIRRVGE